MKKLIFLIMLFCITLGGVAQKWDGFFKPVPDNMFSHDRAVNSIWMFRPTVTVTALTFNLNYTDGKFDGIHSAFISKTGAGVSFAHYIEANGEPYNNFSLNGLVLMPTSDDPTIALAVTVTALQYVNIGVGYDIVKGNPVAENFFLLTGVNITF